MLDPASGECSLLNAAKNVFGNDCEYIGIDVDQDAVNNTKNYFTIKYNDAILPRNVKRKTADYWRDKLPQISTIIANPPWSSEKIYERSILEKAGYTLISGQYDSYVLFIELAYNILNKDGGHSTRKRVQRKTSLFACYRLYGLQRQLLGGNCTEVPGHLPGTDGASDGRG